MSESTNNVPSVVDKVLDGLEKCHLISPYTSFETCKEAFEGWREHARVLEYAQHMAVGAQVMALGLHDLSFAEEINKLGLFTPSRPMPAAFFYNYPLFYEASLPTLYRRYPEVSAWRAVVEATAFEYLNERRVFREAWSDTEKTLIIAQHAWGVSTSQAVDTLIGEDLYNTTPFAWWLQYGGRDVYNWVYERARVLRPSNAKFEKRLMPAWDAARGAYQNDIQMFIEHQPLMSPVVRFQRLTEKLEDVERLWTQAIEVGADPKDIGHLAKTMALLTLTLNHLEKGVGSPYPSGGAAAVLTEKEV